MVFLLFLISIFILLLLFNDKYRDRKYIYNILLLFIFLPLITLYSIYLYYRHKRLVYLYILFIFFLFCVVVFYNSPKYLKVLYIYFKMAQINKDDKNFYIKFNKYSKSIIKINKIGNKSINPCIFIANHAKNNYLGYNIIGALMEKNVKIFTISSKEFRNSLDDKFGCIFVDNFKNLEGEGKYNNIKDLIESQIRKGYSVICFPEYPDKKYNYKNSILYDFRSGFFRIAKELNIPIQIMAINWKMEQNKIILPKLKTNITIKYGKMLDTNKDLDEIMTDAKKELGIIIKEII